MKKYSEKEVRVMLSDGTIEEHIYHPPMHPVTAAVKSLKPFEALFVTKEEWSRKEHPSTALSSSTALKGMSFRTNLSKDKTGWYIIRLT